MLLNEATRDYDTGSSEEEKGHNSDDIGAKKAAIYCIALPAGIQLYAQTHSLYILQVV